MSKDIMSKDADMPHDADTSRNIAMSQNADTNDKIIDPVIGSIQNADSEAGGNTRVGAKDMEAIAMVWSKNILVLAYVIIWMINCIQGIQSNTAEVLTPYVTSAFARHSLTPTVSILSAVISGFASLTLAKILDVFGRPQGYLGCIFLATIGLALTTASNNVETYAAAQVFKAVGLGGIQFCLSVLVADTSTLQTQGLMQAIVGSSSLFTGFLAGPIASGFLKGPGWRWAFGMFTMMIACVSLPLYGILASNYRKAKRQDLVTKSSSHRSRKQSFLHYCREFDVVGLLLLSASVALFLLPFNLYTMQKRGWASPLVLSMLIIGFFVVVTFVVWEKFFAPVTFIPYSMLLDRTAFSTCIMFALLFMSYTIWYPFFLSYLQVAKNLEVDKATYVLQTLSVGAAISSVVAGALIRKTGRFKPFALFLGVPLSVTGLSLMIYVGSTDSGIGYTILSLCLIAAAAEVIFICGGIAMLAACANQNVAVCFAVLGMFGSIGGAIGFMVSSAIWQNTLPHKLFEYLPEADRSILDTIYADLETQLSFAVDSPTRLAVQHAYKDAYLRLLVTSSAISVGGFAAMGLWRDINVIGMKQAKGKMW